DVRLDRAAVAGPDVGHARADGEHLDAELVAGDTRVAEEGHLAQVAADVGAADADAVDAHQRLARPRRRGPVDLDAAPPVRGIQGQGLHGSASPVWRLVGQAFQPDALLSGWKA